MSKHNNYDKKMKYKRQEKARNTSNKFKHVKKSKIQKHRLKNLDLSKSKDFLDDVFLEDEF